MIMRNNNNNERLRARRFGVFDDSDKLLGQVERETFIQYMEYIACLKSGLSLNIHQTST